MRKFWKGAALSLAGMACATAGLAQAPADGPQYEGVDALPDIRLSYTESYAPDTTIGKATQAFVDYVAEHSQGKIQIEVFWSGSLMAIAENPEGIATGLADMGIVYPIYTPADFPVTNWITVLANQATGGAKAGLAAFTAAQWEFSVTNEALNREFNERGLQILTSWTVGAFDMMCKTPVRTLEEARGKRARAAGIVFSKEVEALGMVAVPLVPPEMYEAFSRGIIDCVVLHPMGYQDTGLIDVPGEKYYVNLEFSGWNSTYYVMNKAKWDGLPDLAKQILNDGFTAATEVQLAGTYERHTQFADLIENGTVNALQADSEFRSTLEDFQKRQVDELLSSAPGSLEDPQGVIDEYVGLLSKWRGIMTNDLGLPAEPSDINELIATWRTGMDYAPVVARVQQELMREGLTE